MILESAIGPDEFMSNIDGLDTFINEEVPSQQEEDVWEKPYQGLPDSPDMDNVVDQENAEKAVDTNDQFFGPEVCLPDEQKKNIIARVTKHVKYNTSNPIGIEHPKLFADHSLYEILFPNGQTEELTANMISENMLSWVDSEWHHYQVLKDTSYHSTDGSLLKKIDWFIRIHNRSLHTKKTTRGCKLEVKCKNGNFNLDSVEGYQSLNPVEFAGYAVLKNIEGESAFKWWVKDILLKQYQMISKVKAKYWRTTHKFGF